MPRVYSSNPTTVPLAATDKPAHESLRRSFAVGRAADMARAVDQARIESEIAAAAYLLVKEQAVYALRQSGRSMRDIEAITGLSKSAAGRLAQEMEDDLGKPLEGHLTEPPALLARIAESVEEVWK